jgi:hypothetical protein
MIRQTASPDSIDIRVRQLSATLSQKLGVSLDEIPPRFRLSPAARAVQTNCASCHGVTGRGDGPAGVSLDPPAPTSPTVHTLSDRSPSRFLSSSDHRGRGHRDARLRDSAYPRGPLGGAVYATLLRLPAPRGEVPIAYASSPRPAG